MKLQARAFSGIKAGDFLKLCVRERGFLEQAARLFAKMKFYARQVACSLFSLLVMSPALGYSAEMLLIRSGESPFLEQRKLELATQFYGVHLKVVTAGAENSRSVLNEVRQDDTFAVAIEADALASLDQKALQLALRRRTGPPAPLLIIGVTPETNVRLLRLWSGGAVVDAKRLASATPLHYLVGHVEGITLQLTNVELPFPGARTFYFDTAEHGALKEIMAVGDGRLAVPVFIEADLRAQKVFLLCKKSPDAVAEETADNTVEAFAEIAPAMIFTKYSAGDRGWHALHHYANLTIDDPWLREPYGHLAYKDLLAEMEKHNFHTTIAFIPWNFDRSEASVVALFRDHPERFSICVHGDNHDHKEFDDFGSKSLGAQVAAIRQSLARMEKFQRLTGIPYDNVFVFPHNIGSEKILEALKTYNFAATVNSLNVPMDRSRPLAPSFALRAVTLSFADFPSINRYSATMPNPNQFIGLNSFLDNPLLFYGHQDLFTDGIHAFDGVADEVNQLQPDTRWRGLGDVARNLYMVRLRDDGDYDALTFSSSVTLSGIAVHDSVVHVLKLEADSAAIESVRVDGRLVPFEVSGGYLRLVVGVPAGETRDVVVRYKNDLDIASVSTAKSSPRVYVLRMVSDFRDITLSKYSAGRELTDFYYKETNKVLMIAALAAIMVGMCGTWGLLLLRRKKASVAARSRVLQSNLTPRPQAESPYERCARP